MFVMVTLVSFTPYFHIISCACAEVKIIENGVQLALEYISYYNQAKWQSCEPEHAKWSIKCCNEWIGLINFNVVVALAEIYYVKNLCM